MLHPATSHAASPLKGTITVPGDKSISHRALILASQSIGTTEITGLLEGEDVINTGKALAQMGVTIRKGATWQVQGVGVGGLRAPKEMLDMGNSGTGVRLMMGLVASHDFSAQFTGDASLCSRPMARAGKPLEHMGARIAASNNYTLPLTVTGGNLTPINYTLPVASAQVKSAILLAALNVVGTTTVIEPIPTRDHTERMLRAFGCTITSTPLEQGGNQIELTGKTTLHARPIPVPGDPSSAAFLTVAALIIPGSHLTIKNVCINPHRTGLYTTLQEMGGDITFINKRESVGEEVVDIVVKASKLKGVSVPAERAPSMIDEYPILAVAAACAEGATSMYGLEELKVKESNRLSAIADGLVACGVRIVTGDSSLVVYGSSRPKGGGTIVTHMDHRIAMSFLILGSVAEHPVTVDDSTMINTSFPGFIALLNEVGGVIQTVQAA